MSKKTEAKASSQPTTRAATAADPKGHGQTTAHELDAAKDMLTHKKRGDSLLREDEREELMMNKLDQDGRSDPSSNDQETESSGSLSGKDTWNFALLVVLCKV